MAESEWSGRVRMAVRMSWPNHTGCPNELAESYVEPESSWPSILELTESESSWPSTTGWPNHPDRIRVVWPSELVLGRVTWPSTSELGRVTLAESAWPTENGPPKPPGPNELLVTLAE